MKGPRFPASGSILVGCDPSDRGRDALLLGELLARTTGARLRIVRVVGAEAESAGARGELDRQVAATLGEGPSRETRVASAHSPAHGLLELARADSDLSAVVLGSTHRAGMGRVTPGAVVDRMIGELHRPISVAPRGYASARSRVDDVAAGSEEDAQGSSLVLVRDELRVIGVGFDGTAESSEAVDAAVELGRGAAATLRLIAVGAPAAPVTPEAAALAAAPPSLGPDLQEQLQQRASSLPDELRVLPVLRRGDPAAELIAASEEGLDLLLIGSRGRGRVRRVWLGSVSSRVIAGARCPVMVTPRAVPDGPG